MSKISNRVLSRVKHFYNLQLKSHKASANVMPNAKMPPIISATNLITSLFMKFEPNCCQNHDCKSNHDDTT